MGFLELFGIAIGLSMDAFAVAVCKGLANKKKMLTTALIVGLYFGIFQAVMPLIGYFLGSRFADLIESIDHWVAFVLLAFIGGKMFYEGFRHRKNPTCEVNGSLGFKNMIGLAVATSIDALAVGITFAFLDVSIFPAISLIGITTFVLSALGVAVGFAFGNKFKEKAEMAGGICLILIGFKILLEHLGVIA
ncbi:MAG: manganese efflux pump MntP family protein [Lachnospiraceae bacterium]|jgi:putative Mn2+ efflux pump MntP|nr:manganese efflux pump MntP family protein [Lachnospiraceae bacterium]